MTSNASRIRYTYKSEAELELLLQILGDKAVKVSRPVAKENGLKKVYITVKLASRNEM